ncbi:MAG TPA: 16S rRNA (adenine(1518)-N(6)/adenine(1519)-N(6))-dimethyltransferase RsmA [Oscillatoriaceae cyanobacterium M33_DOE_052]|uniref:Ribosomal RNA small subunit methyltransferase A n=1 Tax=Planktothricoides sp. SpSt-374 TaxID=2282167 RepID=A0A7C3VR72_9CYAN|nr:16S rRNA (adenine(1518)-N(6)/adenine(1519)-N(6))-dimethyltransferase RsmA [Oscillatoriaceae cyanobacterium M33_DOE_052]
MRPKKQFAQYWLRSGKVLERILKAAELSGGGDDPTGEGDRVLEIGPGTGALTRNLLANAKSVVAVEIDRYLCQKLRQKLGNEENFWLLEGDILELDLDAALAEAPPRFHRLNKVVANIPYNITGPILEKLLGKIAQPVPVPYDSIVLLVQKEVALRLCAQAGSRTFGALSVRVQYLASCELICEVPARCFYPVPKVDSAVVRLRPRAHEPAASNPGHLERLVQMGFGSKRKMLRNNLQSLIERDRLSELLQQLEIDPQARAEDLTVPQWVALSNKLA